LIIRLWVDEPKTRHVAGCVVAVWSHRAVDLPESAGDYLIREPSLWSR
jgi:hypothetical protein